MKIFTVGEKMYDNDIHNNFQLCLSRASCIMLNKGKNLVKAVSTLDAILRGNSTKSTAEMKPLVLSSHL